MRIEPLEDRALLSAAPHLPAGWAAQPAFRSHNVVASDTGSASPSGLTPNQVRTWYGLGTDGSGGITGGIMFGSNQADGSGETIAIVDVYDDPSALSDLNAFSANYSLAQFNVSGGPTFKKLNETGGTSLPSASGSSGWSIEESLDVDWAHAMAPKANIILFEASDTGTGLYTAVQTAAKTTGVVVVSMSWSGAEYSGENLDDTTYFTTPSNHPGVTFLSATGDSGAYDSTLTTTVTPQYPAASPNVVAVGGTTIRVSGTLPGETVWGSGTSSGSSNSGGGGGGISAYESQPSRQTALAGVSNYSTTQRVYPDVAADANPYSGVPIYDSYDFGNSTPWAQYGGTSLACPMWAAMIAVADQGRAVAGRASLDGPSQTLPMLYQMAAGDFRDVTGGGPTNTSDPNYLSQNQSSTGPVPYGSTPGYVAASGYDITSGRGGPLANLVIPQLVGGTQLAFGQQPTTAAAGTIISPAITVSVEDALGNVVASDNSNVTLSIANNTGGATLSGTVTVAAVNGVATFSNLSINFAGNYTLTATDTTGSGTFTVNSAAFTVGTPPAVATPAAATPNPITGNSTSLSVLGADGGGESSLTYTWSATSVPAGSAAPTFSANGTNAAKNTTATFSAAGSYVLTATIANAFGGTNTSSVNVTVNQTATSIIVSPTSVGVAAGATQQFAATVLDQFGAALASQPSVSWSSTTGSITQDGLFTSDGTEGMVTAADGSISDTAQILLYQPPTVVDAAAASPGTVTGKTTNLSVLGADAGGESSLIYTWTATTLPSGAAQPTYTANGSNAAKNATVAFSMAGTYDLQATITDANNWSVTSSVTVIVNATLISVGISPGTITISADSQSQLSSLFSVTGLDQFGNSINSPSSYSWSAASGAVTSTGWYTPPSSGSSDTITVASGGINGTATINIATPVGWWKFNETSGTTAHDVGTGTSANGTVGSGSDWLSPTNGTNGTPALSFNGTSSSLVTIGNPSKLAFSGQITLAAWVKLSSVNSSTVEYVIDHRSSVNNDVYLGIDLGQYEVGYQSSSTAFHGVDYPVPSSDAGTWVHLVGTYDGTAWRLYRDGVLVASSTDSKGAGAPNGNWSIGGAASGVTRSSPAYYFSGAIDDARIYSTAISPAAVAGLMAIPPTVAITPAAAPSPVTGTTAMLSVQGADDAGPASLAYTWATTGTSPAAVGFSVNGSNAAQSTVATFTKAGVYNITATIANLANLTTTSTITVTVNQTLTSIAVQAAPLAADGAIALSAVGNDQFGNPMVSQPQFVWSVAGGGAISADGVFTPPYATGSATITATGGAVSGNATVSLPGAALWNSAGNTSWNSAGTWTSSSTNTAVPAPGTRTVTGDNAVFANGAGGTVTLDGASPSLAGLTFGDSGNYTIAQGSGGALHLANGSAAAAVTVTVGTQTITAPVVLDSNITISAAAGTLLNVTGPITANGHTITVTGPGKIVFSGPGSSGFSNTVVAAGKLVIQNPSMLADGSSLTVGDSSFFAAAPAVAAPVGVPALAGASVVKSTPTSVAPASTAAKPTTRSTSPPVIVAYQGGPLLPLWMRPHLQAAASVLAGQDASSSNGDKPAAIQALDAFFASFGR